jgi:predicted secreted protein
MALSKVTIGYGTVVEVGDGGSPEVFSPFGELVSLTPPPYSRDAVDSTHMQSDHKFREFVPGLRDGGEMSFTINFIPGDATSDLVAAHATDDTLTQWRMVFPNAEMWSFFAYLTGFAAEVPLDGKMSATVRVRVSGAPSWVGI